MLGAGRQRHREQRCAEPRRGTFQRCARVLVDHRADIGRRIERIADHQRLGRAVQHAQHAVGDVVLQAEQPQRRAALAGRAERAGQHVGHHLLGQRGAVHDHRVDAAGFRDERNDRPGPRGERSRDRLRGLRAAGESDARDARIVHQRLADRPVARQQRQCRPRHAGLEQQCRRRGPRPAASARPVWRPPHCRRRARRRPGR